MKNLTYVSIKHMDFCLNQLKWGTDFMFQKSDFQNLREMESILILVLFIKI